MRISDWSSDVCSSDLANLRALQKDWNTKIKPLLAKEKEKAAKAEIAAYVDRSVYNLSSIVVLAEADGKRLLLTGDGRGDHTLSGLEEAGLLAPGGTIERSAGRRVGEGGVRKGR